MLYKSRLVGGLALEVYVLLDSSIKPQIPFGDIEESY